MPPKIKLVKIFKKQDGGMINYELNRECVSSVFETHSELFEAKGQANLSLYLFLLKKFKLETGFIYLVNQSILALFLVLIGKKIIYIIDSINNNYPQNIFGKIKGFIIKKVNYLAIKKSIGTIAETEYLSKAIYLEFGLFTEVNNTPFIPLAQSMGKVSYNEDFIRILYVGRLSEEKGKVDLLRFFDDLELNNYKISGIQIEVVIITNICELKEFKFYDNDHIALHPWMPREQLANYYLSSDVFVHLPQNDAFPNCLREAISMGVPCISYNIQGIPEIISDGITGFLLDNYSWSDVSNKILKIKRDRENFRTNCLEYSKLRNKEVYRERLNNLIHKAIYR